MAATRLVIVKIIQFLPLPLGFLQFSFLSHEFQTFKQILSTKYLVQSYSYTEKFQFEKGGSQIWSLLTATGSSSSEMGPMLP